MPRGQYQRRKPEEGAPQPEAALSPRATETRRERRRRDDGDVDNMARMKLAIPRSVQERAKAEGKTLRWMLDTPGRIQQALADDWDRVEGVDPVAASRAEEGQLVLCEKYVDWWAEDQRAKVRRIGQQEQAIERGEGQGPNTYTPESERNQIFRKPGV